MKFPNAASAPPEPRSDRPSTRAGRKAITFYVNREAWEQTRVLSIRQGRSTQAILEELLTQYLADHAEGGT